MTSQELREKFIKYFEKKAHKLLPASSLIPENDSSVLFTSAGMQQFKRYYINPNNAPAKNIVTSQPCFRTSDIEEVGDNTHLTYFEMLGNFSFGGYFKAEAIKMSYEFLTKELMIEPERIWCSVFSGDKQNSRDDESAKILEDMGLKYKDHNRADNFWGPTGDEGPCGPTVEFYIDDVEIWNLVFNEYFKDVHGNYKALDTPGVDTGMGLERLLVIINRLRNVFETDLLKTIIDDIVNSTGQPYNDRNTKAMRRIADHLRASSALIKDGISPGKNEKESVLKTLLRVLFVELNFIMPEINNNPSDDPMTYRINYMFRNWSNELKKIIRDLEPSIQGIIISEYETFLSLKITGLKYFNHKNYQNLDTITGDIIFKGKDTFGLTKDGIVEVWKAKGKKIDANWENQFDDAYKKHQELSRTASAGMFRGGLQSGGEQETKFHTATHLLLASLRRVLGNDVNQKGANITPERIRFDFSYPTKMTDEQIKEVEEMVNREIQNNLPVTIEEMELDEALRTHAASIPGFKYPERVKVYTIKNNDEIVSREICGGPHVNHTGEIGGIFKITKEESSSSGVRRIKAIIE